MLIIRDEQMDVLRAHMRRQYEQHIVKHLREKFPDRTKDLPDKRIRDTMQNGMKKAEGYGLEYEDDIRRFIEYSVMYGTKSDNQEETRWIGDILQRNDLDGTAKMDMIDNCEIEVLRR
jgi:hypothetical protein